MHKLFLLSFIFAPLFLVGCVQTGEVKPSQEQKIATVQKPLTIVRLGHAAPMTGAMAHLGRDNENGARLAIEEINASQLEIGGSRVVFELVTKDDQANPNRAIDVARQLVDSKVNAVIGHLNSSSSIAASKIYSEAGIPQISGSSNNPKYTHQGFKTTFRVMSNDIQQGKMLGEFAIRHGFKSVAIIDDNTVYGRILTDNFQKKVQAAGIKILAVEHISDQATNFRNTLLAIKSKMPELVFFGGMDDQSGLMVKQMKELGVDAKLLTGDGGCTQQFIALGGETAQGHLCALPGFPLERMPKGIEFRRKFYERFHQEVQIYAPYVYDAVMVIVDSMKRSNSVEIYKFLPEIYKTNYDGITSRISFDENGDLKNGGISFYNVNGKRFEYLGTIAVR